MGACAGGVYLQFAGYTKPAVSFLGIPCATIWVPCLNILAALIVITASARGRSSKDSYIMTVAMYSSIAAVVPSALELVLGFMATIEEHEYQIPREVEGVSPYALLTAAAVEVFGLFLLILTIIIAILCHRMLVRHRVNKYLLGTKWAQCKDRPDEDDIGVDHSPLPPLYLYLYSRYNHPVTRHISFCICIASLASFTGAWPWWSVCFVVPIPDHALQKFEANGFTSSYPYDWVSADDDARNKPLVESPFRPQRKPQRQVSRSSSSRRVRWGGVTSPDGKPRAPESPQKPPGGKRVRRSATTNNKHRDKNRRKPAVKSMRNAWEI
ncbi:Hypp2148 [Branchiostoma lanceolatum]|uniref:Hypp2148 protein n=1 Tax=Branchiostoma lanceolatum TaxID=7740 RepID=A0A8K0ERN1_BRALA|nr:Hypp2148 [Branchiostoma lanceolatum]